MKPLLSSLQNVLKGIATLSKEHLPAEFFPTSKLGHISETALIMVQKSNPDYTLTINGVLPYYDMKLVTVATDTKGQLVIKFPIFVQTFTKCH